LARKNSHAHQRLFVGHDGGGCGAKFSGNCADRTGNRQLKNWPLTAEMTFAVFILVRIIGFVFLTGIAALSGDAEATTVNINQK
jgi:hypothetical protein